jgi:hypothetical protein
MRIIREFPLSPTIKASLFSWNGKFILKLECGLLEQSYKFLETEVSGTEEIILKCSEKSFLESIARIFGEMEMNLD